MRDGEQSALLRGPAGPVSETPSARKGHDYSFLLGTKEVLILGPFNILFIFIPLSIVSHFLEWADGLTFAFSVFALTPLAERLGFCTEQIAIHTNDTIGGLLNATFGNATELIVAILALKYRLYRLVQLSLLGSILSNLLLVLGTAFFAGGVKYHTQHFSRISSRVNSVMLVLASMCLLTPTALDSFGEVTAEGVLGVSRATSVVLMFLYGIFLFYQLYTHKSSYENMEDYQNKHEGQDGTEDEENGNLIIDCDGEDDEEDVLGPRYGTLWLALLTVIIAIISDALADTIEDAGEDLHMSAVFLSAIVLPIVGNAAEHAGAVTFAMKNKMDLTLGVAVGSATQIGLFVIPLLVLLGWCSGLSMTLSFGGFEAGSLLLTIIIVTFALKDGVSDWLLGVCLCLAYFAIAAGFWVDTSDSLS